MSAVFTSHIKSLQHFPFIVLLLWGEAISAQTFIVNTTNDTVDKTPGNAICADINGKCSLRAAIMESNAQPASNDTINLDNATYSLNISNTGGSEDSGIEGDLDIRNNLTIQGLGAGKSFIDGNKLDRVFHITNGATATLNDITIRNGQSGGNGGGAKINGNSTGFFNNVVISGNKAANGGGVDIASGSIATIKNSTISDNRGFYAGGIQVNSNSELRLENSTLTQNNASGGGGGMYTPSYSTVMVINSTISGNTAGTGGGIYTISGDLKILSSTITNNKSNYGGGGYFNLNPNLVLRNNILANNTSNNGPNCNGTPAISQGYNLIGNSSRCSIKLTTGDLAGDAINPIDPRIDSLKDNGGASLTHALLPDSPALDAGNPLVPGSGGDACALSDQRGASRIGRGVCDIGAFEASGGGDVWVNAINAPNTKPGRELIQQIITAGNKGPNKVRNLDLSIVLPVGSRNVTITSNIWTCTTNSNVISCTNSDFSAQTETTLALQFIPPLEVKKLISQVNISSISADPITTNNQINLETIINKPPIVTVQSTIKYSEKNRSVSISPTANITDEDDTVLTSANLRIINGYRINEDELYWSGNANIVAQWIPDTATLEFRGEDTIHNYRQALRETIYENSTSDPSGERGISITVSDLYEESEPVFIGLETFEDDSANDTSSNDTDNEAEDFFSDTGGSNINNNHNSEQNQDVANTKISSDINTWLHQYDKQNTENEENEDAAIKRSILPIFNTMKYDDEWVNMGEIEPQKEPLISNFAIAGTASIFFAGLINLYLRAISFFGIFFSSPLLIPFDPLPIMMISNKERRKREMLAKKEMGMENTDGRIGDLLDNNYNSKK